ncbi:unnamed protein product [Aphanomyces euteiches]|uniref:WRKY19-like zinc finger domain-containing protein n=1 Tax=Aphanomyces euteiches TaxID=100861 RepID=A0A6G0W5M5_9STRA|nr:hypothetical protein Ae201684_018489 [Aphanomyces euteiches]KAH9072637.1 hypothetical protein Ae201684P_015712 [Aphanomyces euteiches]KAH9103954.1 hypothetical protein AeMF1_019845 [Aphanomyces euteiches]KAH9119793.1 hypothetical protein LEN26_011432 [Aphanomyces euteiches]KAH9144546.1 hypothetical protein AeRB84_011517 [Aphanomyces euteiches]
MQTILLPPLQHALYNGSPRSSASSQALSPIMNPLPPRRCVVGNCLHFAKIDQTCLLHHRVRHLGMPSPQLGPKRRNKKCKSLGCESFARSGGFCTRHGGGRKCKVEGCTTASQTGGFCRVHGGGSKCKIPNCDQFARVRGLCLPHSRTERDN